jgi:hypothetical protein
MDFTSHRYGPFSEQAGAIIKNVDETLAPLMEAFERNGMLERFAVVLLADHGQVPVKREHYVLWDHYFQGKFGLPTIGGRDGVGGKAGKPKREKFYDRYAVAVAQNGRNAFIYVRRNGESRWRGAEHLLPWAERPTWDEIRNYPTPGGRVNLVDALKDIEGVSLVIGRVSKNAVAVISRDGEGRITVRTDAGNPTYSYRLIGGKDPLGYTGTKAADLMGEKFHSAEEWLKATASLEKPDVVAQLPSLFESDCCGDLFIVPDDDWDFEKKNIGGHGGFLKGEVLVPLIVAGPGIRKGTGGAVRVVDLVPTLLDYLGFSKRKKNFLLDGTSFWKEIADE